MGPWKTPKTRKITFPLRPVQTTVSGKMMPFLVLEPTLSQTEPLCLQIPDLLSLFSKCIQAECCIERARLSWARAALSYWTLSPRLPWVCKHLILFSHILASLLVNQNILTQHTRCAWFHLQLKQNATQTPLASRPILGRRWSWADLDCFFHFSHVLANPIHTSYFPA